MDYKFTLGRLKLGKITTVNLEKTMGFTIDLAIVWMRRHNQYSSIAARTRALHCQRPSPLVFMNDQELASLSVQGYCKFGSRWYADDTSSLSDTIPTG